MTASLKQLEKKKKSLEKEERLLEKGNEVLMGKCGEQKTVVGSSIGKLVKSVIKRFLGWKFVATGLLHNGISKRYSS